MAKQTKLERKAAEQYAQMTPNRACWECRECCIVPGIEEFAKPARTPCGNLCPSGCGIYADRPKVYSDFVCYWLEGRFSHRHRPDMSGIIVHGSTDQTRAEHPVPHVLVSTRFRRKELEGRRDWQEIQGMLLAAGYERILLDVKA